MRRSLALLPLVILTACGQPGSVQTGNALHAHGYEHVGLSEPSSWWWLGPCQWSEPYSALFVATKDGARWNGTVCAMDERGETTRIAETHVIPWASTMP